LILRINLTVFFLPHPTKPQIWLPLSNVLPSYSKWLKKQIWNCLPLQTTKKFIETLNSVNVECVCVCVWDRERVSVCVCVEAPERIICLSLMIFPLEKIANSSISLTPSPGVNFTHMLTQSFYACRSQKPKMAYYLTIIFVLLDLQA